MRSTMDWDRATRWMGLALLVTLAFAGAPQQADAAPPQMPGVQMTQAWPGVTFKRPICVTNNGSSLFICQQEGQILRADKYRGSGPVPRPTLYLDLTSKVESSGQGGVLSMAFHPKDRSRFFVAYTARGTASKYEMRVAEFQGTDTACNPASEFVCLTVPQKRNMHYGGCLSFGPDGMLYISVGDDGEKQPQMQLVTQSHTSLNGKILRIDVNAPHAPKIPADNPWATAGGQLPYMFAIGYRNPWRIAFDAQGRLWTVEPGMKGPTSQEWVTQIVKAGNGRWPHYEGTRRRAEVPGNLTPNTKATAPAFAYTGAQTGGDNAGRGRQVLSRQAHPRAGRQVRLRRLHAQGRLRDRPDLGPGRRLDDHRRVQGPRRHRRGCRGRAVRLRDRRGRRVHAHPEVARHHHASGRRGNAAPVRRFARC